ncbi:MAG: hypothetical protein M3161_07615 [Actinomycetota bacterium]|nr:hypothetical protein [Actinomycetota bacterium]
MTAREAVAADTSEQARRRWFAAVDIDVWRRATIFVVVTRLAFFAAAYGTTQLLTAAQGGSSPEGFLDIWSRWDAQHFLVAAEHGWSGPEALSARTAAFFPLYPLAIRALSALGANPIAAGLIISAVATIVATAYLARLAERDIGPGSGTHAALYLLLFPTAVFLVAPYSEALFLAGAIPAFYYAREGRWRAAALPATVAVATRAAGIFLLVALGVELATQLWRRREGLRRALEGVIALAVASLPLLLFGLHLRAVRGSFWQYRIDQEVGWGRQTVDPVQSFLATWNTRVGNYDSNWIFAWRIEIIAALAGVLFTIWALARREWAYATYMGLFMTALMTSAWYFSIPRMLLTFFPIMLFVASATRERPERYQLIVLALAPIAAMGVIVYTRGAWFF